MSLKYQNILNLFVGFIKPIYNTVSVIYFNGVVCLLYIFSLVWLSYIVCVCVWEGEKELFILVYSYTFCPLQLRNLSSLDLRHISELNNETVMEVVRNCRNLSSLNLCLNWSINDRYVIHTSTVVRWSEMKPAPISRLHCYTGNVKQAGNAHTGCLRETQSIMTHLTKDMCINKYVMWN